MNDTYLFEKKRSPCIPGQTPTFGSVQDSWSRWDSTQWDSDQGPAWDGSDVYGLAATEDQALIDPHLRIVVPLVRCCCAVGQRQSAAHPIWVNHLIVHPILFFNASWIAQRQWIVKGWISRIDAAPHIDKCEPLPRGQDLSRCRLGLCQQFPNC